MTPPNNNMKQLEKILRKLNIEDKSDCYDWYPDLQFTFSLLECGEFAVGIATEYYCGNARDKVLKVAMAKSLKEFLRSVKKCGMVERKEQVAFEAAIRSAIKDLKK